MSFTNFNQSTWLAARSIEAEAIGPPPVPKKVALPGAKTAIDHDQLLAHHDAGHDQETIVQRANDRWQRENADRLAEHEQWTRGPYANAIEELRHAQAEADAVQQRRMAKLERLLAREDD